MRSARSLLVFAAFLSWSTFATAYPSDKVSSYIVGGVEASPGEFPWIGSIQDNEGWAYCGATLIKKNWVITAAHCVKRYAPAQILLGLYEKSKPEQAEHMTTKKVVTHPLYKNLYNDYDFALIQLDHDSAIEPIELNKEEIVIPIDSNSLPVMSTVAGWGDMGPNTEDPDKLMKVDVPLVSRIKCQSEYGPIGYDITDRMLCAGYEEGGKDSCQGDSGGPLIIRTTRNKTLLAGVVSWGMGCARPNFAGVYSKINSVIEWIEKEISDPPPTNPEAPDQ
ncbi:MAG: serine protease [Bdellovibrio sp.]|nr:serine protease [Bdellovibrio sp.]